MSLVIVKVCVEIMTIYFISLVVALGCLDTSLQSSPFYVGLCLIVGWCSGCLAVLGFDGVFSLFVRYVGSIFIYYCYVC